jgi:hypothetical protein
MRTSLDAQEQSIQKIFSEDYLFDIPGYQRPYAWTIEQAGELFDDLWGFMTDRDEPVAEMPPYFLGSIVLIKPSERPECDVVDGQQRLTTLTILLSAIRALVDEQHQQDLTSYIYNPGSRIGGTRDSFRVSLRERDRTFFQEYVQKSAGIDSLLVNTAKLSDSQSNIRENARLFFTRLEKLSMDERLALAKFIVQRCYLVVVATPDLDSAFRIFAVLNSRGLDLGATDILKAEIIGKISQEEQDAYTRLWEDTEEDLGRNRFEDLFGHVRMIYRKSKPKGTLLKEFREHVAQGRESKALVDEVLLPMASAYGDIIGADWSSTARAEDVNTSLRWLNRLIFSDWIPPALSFMSTHDNDPDAMARFFQDLERLGYFFMVTRAGINPRIERFSRLTEEIENNSDLATSTSALQLSDQEKQQFREALDDQLYYRLVARAVSAVLLRLDSLLSSGEASYDFPVISIEHVLPQTPQAGSEWMQWFPDEAARDHWTHRLGNLVLLNHSKNSQASNWDFKRKKDVYFARDKGSPFVLTSNVLKEAEWTEDVVARRQRELLGFLCSHWRLDVSDGAADTESGDIDEEASALRTLRAV